MTIKTLNNFNRSNGGEDSADIVKSLFTIWFHHNNTTELYPNRITRQILHPTFCVPELLVALLHLTLYFIPVGSCNFLSHTAKSIYMAYNTDLGCYSEDFTAYKVTHDPACYAVYQRSCQLGNSCEKCIHEKVI